MERAAFDKWLRRQVYTDRDDAGRCMRLVLRHVAAGSKVGQEVITINIREPDTNLDDDQLRAWEEEIEQAAIADASGLGGLQSYVVHSYFEHLDKPVARFTFRVEAEADPDDEDSSDLSEPPNRHGLVSQTMRHLEAVMKISTLGSSSVISSLQRTVSRQAETIENLVKEKFDNLTAMEELRSAKHERDLATAEQQARMELHRDMFNKVSALMPVVLHKLIGKGAMVPVGKGTSATDAMLDSLVESMDEAQLATIMPTLRPEQQILLLELIQSRQEGREPQSVDKVLSPRNGEPTSTSKQEN
jgi:hypothetical protein